MDNWEELIFDELIEDKLIGLVRNTKQQSFDFEFDYLKMNNITNDGKLNLKDLVKVNASTDEVEKYKLQKGDFLFNTRNSIELVGKTAIYDFELSKALLFNNNIMRSRFKSDFDPYFINYQFQSSEFQERLEKIKSGTTSVAAIYYKSLRDIKLKFPPLPEQQRIVAKLDGLFAKIDKAIGLLEANILHMQALMGSVLDAELSRFKTKTLKIKDVLSEINSGFACNKSNEIPDGYVHLRTHNIDVFGNLNFDKMIKINPNKVDLKKNKIRKNDILFNNTNSKELVGKTALVDQDYDYGYSNHLTRIRLNEDLVLPEFFVNYMINLHSQGYFLQICKKWIGQAGVNTGMLKDTEIKFPSIKNQIILNKKIDSIKESATELINQNNKKLTHLKALKSSLLYQAFKGEL